MEIQPIVQDDGTRVAVHGEADADNCHELGAALLDESLIGPVRLDLAGLSFLDSSAVSELLGIQQELATRGIELSIVETSPAVHRVLEITGLLDVFGIDAS
ncbi:MAG: STAS domain-containing protein [Acidimicrobiales bacterium]